MWVRSLGIWRRRWQPAPVFLLEIPWTGEPGRLQSMGSQRARHDWAQTSREVSLLLAHSRLNSAPRRTYRGRPTFCWKKTELFIARLAFQYKGLDYITLYVADDGKSTPKIWLPSRAVGAHFIRPHPHGMQAETSRGFPRAPGLSRCWKGQPPALLPGPAPALSEAIHHSQSLPFSHAAWAGNGSGLLTEHCLSIVWSKADRERKIHSWHQSH